MPPTSVILLLKNLLKHSKRTVSAKKMRLIESYAPCFIHGVSNGQVLYTLKTGKTVDFKKTLPYSLSPVALKICFPDGIHRHTAKNKLKDILLQDLEDHTYEGPQSLQEYAIVVDMIALINTILNKSSKYSELQNYL